MNEVNDDIIIKAMEEIERVNDFAEDTCKEFSYYEGRGDYAWHDDVSDRIYVGERSCLCDVGVDFYELNNIIYKYIEDIGMSKLFKRLIDVSKKYVRDIFMWSRYKVTSASPNVVYHGVVYIQHRINLTWEDEDIQIYLEVRIFPKYGDVWGMWIEGVISSLDRFITIEPVTGEGKTIDEIIDRGIFEHFLNEVDRVLRGFKVKRMERSYLRV